MKTTFQQLTEEAIENSNVQIAQLQGAARNLQASEEQRGRETLIRKNAYPGTFTSTTSEQWREWANKYRMLATANDSEDMVPWRTRLFDVQPSVSKPLSVRSALPCKPARMRVALSDIVVVLSAQVGGSGVKETALPHVGASTGIPASRARSRACLFHTPVPEAWSC